MFGKIKKKSSIFMNLLRFIFIVISWIALVLWGILTYSIIFEGIMRNPLNLIEGIKGRIWHIYSLVFFSGVEDQLLSKLSEAYFSYILVTFIMLSLNFIRFIMKYQKRKKLAKSEQELCISLKNNFKPRWIVVCLLLVTALLCFYSFKIVIYFANSKYGVESIIRNEASLNISKEQPLFINNEIQGITFDEAARVISIFYLKYIGLIYLEAIFVFLLILFVKRKRKLRHDEETNTS